MKIFINYEPPQKGAVLLKAFLSRAVALVLLLTVSFIYAQSPGGVSANLALWLSADSGGASWTDRSPLNTTVTRTGTVVSTNNQVNFNPGLVFSGTTSYYDTGLNIARGTYANVSVFAVGNGRGENSRLMFTSSSANNHRGLASNVFACGNVPTYTPKNGYGVYRATYVTNTANASTLSYNGVQQLATTDNNGTAINMKIGGYNANSFDIAEILAYRGTLTPTQVNQIESYLALKYGASLGSNYILSDGSTTVWNTVTNAGYNNNIAGIGRDDDSGLSQKQSQSVNSGLQPVIGNVTIAATNQSNSNSLNTDMSSMVWGSDTGSTNFTTAFAFGGLNNRMARIWRVQEIGTVGTVKVALKVSDLPGSVTNPTLLVSSDAVFDGTDTRQTMVLETIGGVQYYTTTVDLTSGQFFSFAGFVTAPGGVLGSAVWLKSDTGITYSSGNNVSRWSNLVNLSNDYLSGTGNVTHNVSTNLWNFNPTLSFLSSTLISQNNVPTANSQDYTKFAVVNSAPGGAGGRSYIESSFTSSGNWNFAFIGSANPTYLPIEHSSGAWTTSNFVSGNFYNDYIIATQRMAFNVAAGTWANVNGKTGVKYNQSTAYTANRSVLGSYTGTLTNGLNGYLPEFINYTNALNAQEINRIESYLALKYGVTLDQTVAQNYLASDGSTIFWDATANSTYKNNIAGIGRDDASALSQKQSQSINSGIQPVIGNGNIFDTNANNSNSFGADKTFMMWGSDAGSDSFATAFAFGGLNNRMARIWKVQETGTVGTVKVALAVSDVPGSVTNPTLLLSTDAVFDGTDTRQTMVLETIGGIQYYTTTVDFTSGQFFSFAGFVAAPGGVLGTALWLKADSGTSSTVDNTAISQWNDQANANNAVQSTTASQPVYKDNGTSILNFNPTLVFDGTNDYLTVPYSPSYNGDITVFSMHNLTDISSYRSPIASRLAGSTTKGWNWYYNAGVRELWTGDNSATNWSILFSSTYSVSTPELLTFDATLNATNSIKNIYVSNRFLTGVTNGKYVSNTTNNLCVGCNSDPNWYWSGPISEQVLYPRVLTNLERLRVNSYLSIKYGVTLSRDYDGDGTSGEVLSGSIVEGDYVSSDGVTRIWNSDATYQNNIAGIGRDDASALSQKQSQSENAGIQPVIGNGNIFDTNANNTNSFSADKSFMIWGSDTGSTSFATPFAFGSSNFRMTRVWKVQETGTVGTVKVALLASDLPVSVAQPILLRSTDVVFDGTDTSVPMNLETIGGIQYYTATIDFATGQYFTFAAFLTAPGGVAGVSLWLKADKGVTYNASNQVSVWTDQSGNSAITTQATSLNSSNVSAVDNSIVWNPSSVNFNPSVVYNYTSGRRLRGNTSTSTTWSGVLSIYGVAVSFGSSTNFSAVFSSLYKSLLVGIGSSVWNWTIDSNGAGNAGSQPALPFNTLSIGNGIYKSDAITNSRIYRDGTDYTNGTSGSNTASVTNYFEIGGRTDGSLNGRVMGGKIPEVIVYNADHSLTPLDMLRINSYLSIKYGSTLGRNNNGNATPGEVLSGSILEGDYVASDGSIRFWASDATYQNNIAGIGRDNASDLIQKQSQSANTGNQIIMGLASIAATNTANTGSFAADKQFLVWGDNDQSGSSAFTGIPGYNSRLNRVWKVKNTNSLNQSVQVLVPLALVPATSSLLAGTDATFAGSYQVYNPTGTVTVNSVSYRAFTLPAVMVNQASFYMTFAFYEQSPGGVRSEALWLRGDAGLAGVTSWLDQSGNNRNLRWDITNCQGHTSRGQMVLGKTLNFNSVASFSDADWTWGFTQTDISRTTTPNADVAIVYKAVSPSVQDVWSTDLGGALDERSLTTTQIGNDNTAIAYSGGNSGFATINVASFKNTTANGSNVLINGNNIRNFTGSTKYVGCPQITIGDVWGAQNPFKGLIGEFVVYRSNITAIERIQLNSYLALKYGITLGRNNNGNATSGEVVSGAVVEGDYLASDGITRTWNSDAIYQNNIVGLGRDDISAFHQRITTSQSASADIITLSTDANFTNNNQSGGSGHTDITNDKSFFITGNNNAATSYTLKSGLSNGMNALMDRVWKVQQTGTAQDVFVKTTSTKASYLVYSSDATFASGVTYVPLSGGATAGIQIPSGNYFTFAAFITAPGGVYTDLKIWHQADSGVTATSNAVTAWENIVDNRFLTNGSVSQRPTLTNGTSAIFNYNPYVNFTTSSNSLYDAGTRPFKSDGDITFFSSVKPPVSSSAGRISFFQINNPSTSAQFDNLQWSYGLGYGRNGTSNIYANYSGNLKANLQSILTFTHNGASNRMNGYQNLSTILNNLSFVGAMSVGGYLLGSDGPFGGNDVGNTGPISEHIAYSRVLSSTEIQRVQSYLAIKTGLSFNQNHLASDGVTVVWTAGSGYDNNIIGLAKDRTSTLHQRISTSQMPVRDIITLSTDNNFTNPNQSGAGGHTDIVNDRYFFMTGNNGQAAVFTQKTGLANNLRVVMSRVWRVQQTGTAQNIYINVNNSRATYLIYSTDPTFSSGITYVPLTSGTTSALQIPTGNYFTFAAPATGPGGVTDNLVRWYRADRDVTTGSTLRWADQMQNSDAVQSVAGNQPTYNTTGSALLNFNSSFTFNSANANYLSFSDTGMASGSTSRSVFGVGRTSVTGGTFEWISSYGTSGSGQNFGLMRSGNNVLVTTFGSDLLASTSNPYASNTPVLSYGAASGGTLFGTFNARPLNSIGGSVSTSLNVGRIGTRQSLGEYWNGIISEVVYYNKIPTTNEKQRVDSYMGLKYGVSLGTSSSLFTYLASDNTPFWTGDATYQNNIAAIGRDDFSDLQQKQSQSVNSGNQVILGLDTITGSNDTNTGSFDNDLQFLAWGDNNTAGTTPFTAVYPNRNRLSRVWKAQNTGSFGKDVQVLIPASLIGNLDVPSLLYSTSATFASGNLTYASTGTVNINSVNYYSFTLPASQVNTPVFYFTIAYYTKAPGGVEGENLWLRADDGVSATTDNTPVSQWNDQSGNGSHGTQATGSKQPVYRNDISVNMNFNPVMNFSSASSQNFDITGDLAIGGQQSIATFAVADASAGARYFLEPKATGNNLLQFRSTTQGNSTLTLSNGTSVTNTLAGTGASVLYSGWRATGTLFAGVNGNAGTSVVSATNWVNGPLSLGAAYNQTAFTNGKIPEVVEYSKSLTAIERQRVNSYLSLKYGITMDQSTIQDYLASDGTISWAKDAVYKFNIAGIGRDDITALNQKQSQSVNTGSQVAVSLGDAEATNSANINTFNTDMQYLIWGDDNGSLSTTTTTGNVLASNGNTYTKRMTRVWRMQNKGSFAQDIIVYFPTSAFPSASAAGLIYATTAAKLSDGTATVIPADATTTVNGTDYYVFPVPAASLAGLSYMSFTTATAVCYKPAVTAGTALNTKAGITSLARAGSAGDNWPMVRNGGWLALEAKTKGMVINRVRFNASNQPVADDGTTLILTSPIEGMLVMDVTNRIFKIYTSKDGGATYAWYAFGEQSCPD